MTDARLDSAASSDADLATLRSLFDAGFYLAMNPDVQAASIDPFRHFVDYGFREQRDPSPFIDLRYLRSPHWRPEGPPASLAALDRLLAGIGPGSTFAASVLVCPDWIAQALGVRFDGLAAMLDLPLRAGQPFSPHPGLAARPVADRATTVAGHLASLDARGIRELSLIDLEAYIRDHRDLAYLSDDPRGAFEHAWTQGIAENRLSYPGLAAPRGLTAAQAFRDLAAQLLVRGNLRPSHDMRRALRALPEVEIRMVEVESAGSGARHGLPSQDPDGVIEMSAIFAASLQHQKEHLVAWRAGPPAPAVLARAEASDLDLLAGRGALSSRRVVYSANLGNYDDFPVPPELPDCDYVMITDAPDPPAGSAWTVIRPLLVEADVKRRCLWYKTHPSELFPQAEFVTWIDSNILCDEGAGEVLRAHEALSEVASFRHPDRDCVFDEIAEVRNLGLDHDGILERAAAAFEAEGMPRRFGLFETNVLFSRARDPAVRSLFADWWGLVCLGSRRDQISFTVASWRNLIAVGPLDGASSAKSSRHFSKRRHLDARGRTVR